MLLLGKQDNRFLRYFEWHQHIAGIGIGGGKGKQQLETVDQTNFADIFDWSFHQVNIFV